MTERVYTNRELWAIDNGFAPDDKIEDISSNDPRLKQYGGRMSIDAALGYSIFIEKKEKINNENI